MSYETNNETLHIYQMKTECVALSARKIFRSLFPKLFLNARIANAIHHAITLHISTD